MRDEYKEYLLGFDAGGSRAAVTKGHLEEALILIPERSALNAFQDLVQSLKKKKSENDSQSHSLTKLRDTLLPKLISGELRIRDVEKDYQGRRVNGESRSKMEGSL